MKPKVRVNVTLGRLLLALSVLPIAASGAALAQKSADAEVRIKLAINEGGAANADYTETMFRYQEFSEVVEKALGRRVVIVAARNRDRLQETLKSHGFELLIARPNDVPAQAIRDFGYQLIATAKEPSQCWLVVTKNSRLKTIADVKGKTIVTPDQYSNMWRAANAMLRDNNIDMRKEQVKAMRDQAAIAWSLENGFYDVGVLNSVSGPARSWEKNGGRVIAKSRDLPNMPFIASPEISPQQVAKLRAAVLALDSSDGGRAILKKIGLTGFQSTPEKAMLDFLAWLGELEKQ
jgi:phosphonate transport system substrate-binding protein